MYGQQRICMRMKLHEDKKNLDTVAVQIPRWRQSSSKTKRQIRLRIDPNRDNLCGNDTEQPLSECYSDDGKESANRNLLVLEELTDDWTKVASHDQHTVELAPVPPGQALQQEVQQERDKQTKG